MIEPTVQVYITSLAGHRSRYVRTLLEHTATDAPVLEIVTFDGTSHLPAQTRVRVEDGRPGPIRRGRAIVRAIRRAEDRQLLLLDGDASAVELLTIVLAPLVFSQLRISTLIMRPPTRWRAPTTTSALRSNLKLALLRIALSTGRVSVHPLDDLTGTWSSSVTDRHLKNLQAVTDPVDLRPGDLPVDLPADLPRPWTLCPGRLVARKNLGLILEAWDHRPTPEGTLILAGDSDATTRSLLGKRLAEPLPGVWWLDRWLEEDELDRLVVESDVVLLLHDNAAPTRNLGKALAAGTPVIGTRIPQFERLGPDYSVTTIDLSVDALTDALARHVQPPRRGPGPGEAGSPARFAGVLLGVSTDGPDE